MTPYLELVLCRNTIPPPPPSLHFYTRLRNTAAEASFISVSDPFSLNPDPAKNLNPDPSYFLTLSEKNLKLLNDYKIFSSREVN